MKSWQLVEFFIEVSGLNTTCVCNQSVASELVYLATTYKGASGIHGKREREWKRKRSSHMMALR